MKHRIAMYGFYFGKWPTWIHLYLETLRRNPSIDFYFFTDCDTGIDRPPNVFFKSTDLTEYVSMASHRLGVPLAANSAVKLCDLRPFVGVIHEELFAGYDFYGWADSDLLFGDIRSFCTEELLSRFDVFSSHQVRIAGHFSLFRNNRRNRNMYKHIYRWREHLANPEFVGLDEHGITNAYLMTFFDRANEKFNTAFDNFVTRACSAWRRRRLWLEEQYTTPFVAIPWLDGTINSDQPDTWFFRDGVVSNSRDVGRRFLYVHFMNFRHSRWRHDGTRAPWEGKEDICTAKIEHMTSGIRIDATGIHPLAISG